MVKRKNDNTLPGIAWNGLNYCAGRVVFTSNQYFCINVIGFLCSHMFFILYIPPYSFCNTPFHISYLVVYESRSLRRSVHLFTGLAWNGLYYWNGQLELTPNHYFVSME